VQLRANSHAYWGNLGDAHRWNPPTKGEAADAYATAIRLAGETLHTNPGDNELRIRRALYRVKSGDVTGALGDVALTAGAEASPAMLFYQTVIYELAGRRTAALESLERTLAVGYSLREVQIEPELVALRADARYQMLLSRRKQQRAFSRGQPTRVLPEPCLPRAIHVQDRTCTGLRRVATAVRTPRRDPHRTRVTGIVRISVLPVQPAAHPWERPRM
jgi:hypothetical protein